MRPSTTGATGELAVMYSMTTFEQVVARLQHVRAAGQRRVAVAAGEVHEVVGDDADGVGRTDRRERARRPVGAFQSPVTIGVEPGPGGSVVQVYVILSPDTCGNRPVPPANAGLHAGWRPLSNAVRQLLDR